MYACNSSLGSTSILYPEYNGHLISISDKLRFLLKCIKLIYSIQYRIDIRTCIFSALDYNLITLIKWNLNPFSSIYAIFITFCWYISYSSRIWAISSARGSSHGWSTNLDPSSSQVNSKLILDSFYRTEAIWKSSNENIQSLHCGNYCTVFTLRLYWRTIRRRGRGEKGKGEWEGRGRNEKQI